MVNGFCDLLPGNLSRSYGIAMFLWDPTDDSLGWSWSYPLSWGHCVVWCGLVHQHGVDFIFAAMAHILSSSWCRSSLKDSVHVMVLSWAKWTFVLPLYIFVWTITTSSSPRHHKWCWGGLFYAPEFSLVNHWNQATGEQNALQEKARTEARPSMAMGISLAHHHLWKWTDWPGG